MFLGQPGSLMFLVSIAWSVFRLGLKRGPVALIREEYMKIIINR